MYARSNILIYKCLFIFRVSFLVVIYDLFIYLFTQMIFDLFNQMCAKASWFIIIIFLCKKTCLKSLRIQFFLLEKNIQLTVERSSNSQSQKTLNVLDKTLCIQTLFILSHFIVDSLFKFFNDCIFLGQIKTQLNQIC